MNGNGLQAYGEWSREMRNKKRKNKKTKTARKIKQKRGRNIKNNTKVVNNFMVGYLHFMTE